MSCRRKRAGEGAVEQEVASYSRRGKAEQEEARRSRRRQGGVGVRLLAQTPAGRPACAGSALPSPPRAPHTRGTAWP